MPQSLRPLLITAALLGLLDCIAISGCASKPPPPESTVATSATVPPKPTPSTVADPPSSVEGGQTSDERRAALDKRLNDSLGAFDAKLRSEQQKLAQERDARQVTVATVSAAGGLQGAATAGAAATRGGGDANSNNPSGSDAHRNRGQTRSTHAGDLKSDKSGAGTVASSGNGAVANEIPDGSDDDIVARRLRKAAEQETDPELKDKLWKEYVEYKKNASGQ